MIKLIKGSYIFCRDKGWTLLCQKQNGKPLVFNLHYQTFKSKQKWEWVKRIGCCKKIIINSFMSNLYRLRFLVSFFYLLISITLIHLHCLIISRTATYLSRYWDPAFKSRIYLVCRSGEKVLRSQFLISNIPKLSFLSSFVCILYP